MTNNLELRQAQRYAVLRYMYGIAIEKENNPEWTYFTSKSIAETLPHTEQEIESVLTYLEGKRLVEIAYRTLTLHETKYKLAYSGIEEIERSMQTSDKATKHFPPQIVQNFFGTVGAVPTGSYATANVTQNIGPNLSDVLRLVGQLKPGVAELPQEHQEDALASVGVLEDELRAEDRNPKRIRGLLSGLKGFAQHSVSFAAQVAALAKQLKDLNIF